MPSIDFKKDTVGNILRSIKNLRVPINQRAYQWKAEHVEDLCKDLNGAISNNDDEYFLGTIVVIEGKPKGIEVYDGQQRLATSMIIVAAIRDYFHWNGKTENAEEITRQILYSRDIETLQAEPHFTLSLADSQFFTDYVLRIPGDPARSAAKADTNKDSHEKIVKAAETAGNYITNIAKSLNPNQATAALHKWIQFLNSSARVIWVQVAEQKTAYRIFETMNDRGLKLSAADLLKNYLYSQVEKDQPLVIQKWQGMIAVLETLGDNGAIVDYIRYFWITSNGHTRSNDLFDEIKKKVDDEPKAIKWATELESRAHDYAALYTSSHDAWSSYHAEVRARVETLRFLEVSQIRPLLLAAFGKFTAKEMSKLLAASVNWSVRVLLGGVPSGTLEGHYSKNAKKVTEGAIKTTADLAKEMAAIIPDDTKFKAAVETALVADAQLARYYLRVLQMQADKKISLLYVPNDGQMVTLEHILPRTPGADWKHFSPEQIRANRNRLGNLVLLDEVGNSKIGNVGYATKKPTLAKCVFTLTQSAAKYTDWTPVEIADRQKALAELAVKAWPVL